MVYRKKKQNKSILRHVKTRTQHATGAATPLLLGTTTSSLSHLLFFCNKGSAWRHLFVPVEVHGSRDNPRRGLEDADDEAPLSVCAHVVADHLNEAEYFVAEQEENGSRCQDVNMQDYSIPVSLVFEPGAERRLSALGVQSHQPLPTLSYNSPCTGLRSSRFSTPHLFYRRRIAQGTRTQCTNFRGLHKARTTWPPHSR